MAGSRAHVAAPQAVSGKNSGVQRRHKTRHNRRMCCLEAAGLGIREFSRETPRSGGYQKVELDVLCCPSARPHCDGLRVLSRREAAARTQSSWKGPWAVRALQTRPHCCSGQSLGGRDSGGDATAPSSRDVGGVAVLRSTPRRNHSRRSAAIDGVEADGGVNLVSRRHSVRTSAHLAAANQRAQVPLALRTGALSATSSRDSRPHPRRSRRSCRRFSPPRYPRRST